MVDRLSWNQSTRQFEMEDDPASGGSDPATLSRLNAQGEMDGVSNIADGTEYYLKWTAVDSHGSDITIDGDDSRIIHINTDGVYSLGGLAGVQPEGGSRIVDSFDEWEISTLPLVGNIYDEFTVANGLSRAGYSRSLSGLPGNGATTVLDFPEPASLYERIGTDIVNDGTDHIFIQRGGIYTISVWAQLFNVAGILGANINLVGDPFSGIDVLAGFAPVGNASDHLWEAVGSWTYTIASDTLLTMTLEATTADTSTFDLNDIEVRVQRLDGLPTFTELLRPIIPVTYFLTAGTTIRLGVGCINVDQTTFFHAVAPNTQIFIQRLV